MSAVNHNMVLQIFFFIKSLITDVAFKEFLLIMCSIMVLDTTICRKDHVAVIEFASIKFFELKWWSIYLFYHVHSIGRDILKFMLDIDTNDVRFALNVFILELKVFYELLIELKLTAQNLVCFNSLRAITTICFIFLSKNWTFITTFRFTWFT